MTVESRPRTPQKTKRPAATLHVLVYPESGRMVAHVLETDTVSDGETPAAALRSVGEALRLEFAFDAREPNAVRAFETPAPTACWIALKSARLTSSTRHVLPELGATTLLAYRIDEAPRG